MLFSPQIPLQLEPRQGMRFDNFVCGSNRAVVEALQQALHEPGSNVYLFGAEGSGKTHLLNALCQDMREAEGRAFYLALKHLPGDAISSLKGLEGLDLVCIDDVHTVAGDKAWEEALFHFFNRARDARTRLVIASRHRLSKLNLGLPDLASRLAWGLRLPLANLEDEDKLKVIELRSRALGISLPDDVLAYLMKRHDRSLKALIRVVEKLNHAALTNKRRVTVPLAREVLRAAGPAEES